MGESVKDMTNKEFQIACLIWNDSNAMIAAGKVQHWDVVKWALAVNLGLAAVSIVKDAGSLLVALSILVALVGQFLVSRYNRRMTGARAAANRAVDFLKANEIDIDRIQGPPDLSRGPPEHRDYEELATFSILLACSILPVFGAWIVSGMK
jgi:hypothetical protein